MEIITACPICRSKELKTYMETIDHFLSKEAFKIDQCDSCSFLFTNPRPYEKDSAAYYQSEAYISHSNVNKGIIPKIYQAVRNYSIKKKVGLVKSYSGQGSVLDIGCGTGHFLSALKKAGFRITGIEPGDSARSLAQVTFNLDIYPTIHTPRIRSETFDVISLWHVLEHVYDLENLLDFFQTNLKKNGILIVAVPNPESKDAMVYKEFWAAYDLPRHLYHFTKDTLQLLFEKNNFRVERILPMKFDAYYVSLLSEKYKTGKSNKAKAMWNGFVSNLAARRTMNYSSLIYVLKPENG